MCSPHLVQIKAAEDAGHAVFPLLVALPQGSSLCAAFTGQAHELWGVFRVKSFRRAQRQLLLVKWSLQKWPKALPPAPAPEGSDSEKHSGSDLCSALCKSLAHRRVPRASLGSPGRGRVLGRCPPPAAEYCPSQRGWNDFTRP